MKFPLLALACGLLATPALAAHRTTYLDLGPNAPATIYEPAQPGPRAKVAMVTIHPFANYIGHSSCANMAERGYIVLCANHPWVNNQYGNDTVERFFPTIKAAVQRAKRIPGVEKIVLIGHSAGAPMMAYYQNVAQNGPSVCKGPEKLMPCDDALVRDLPAADALVLLDPHLGDAFSTMTYIDPAIADEAKPAVRTKALDLYDPSNGYDPEKRRATYSTEFRKTFLAAQAARNASLIARAQKLLADVRSNAGGAYGDDMPFVVPGAIGARLWQPDTSLLRKTKREHLLLKADGTASKQTLISVRVGSGNAREAAGYGSVLHASARSFLGARALRTTPDYNQTEDDITGVDWASSNTSILPHIKGVTVPVLIEVMTGHYFLRPGEMILDASGSADREMVAVEGASHVFTPCAPCGATPTQFGDTVKRVYDHLDGWLAKRF